MTLSFERIEAIKNEVLEQLKQGSTVEVICRHGSRFVLNKVEGRMDLFTVEMVAGPREDLDRTYNWFKLVVRIVQGGISLDFLDRGDDYRFQLVDQVREIPGIYQAF